MAAYFTLELVNLPRQCVIQINCTKTGEAPGYVTSVNVKRRLNGTSVWQTIGSVTIGVVDDFTFSVQDIHTKSRYTYDYMVIPVKGEIEQIGVIDTIKCEFDAVYVSDVNSTYICEFNPNYESNMNNSVVFVAPINSQYPYRIRNGSASYSTGSVTGLFVPYSETCAYTQEYMQSAATRTYKDAFLSFLMDNNSKLLKTYDGHMWYVGIDANPKENKSDFDGANEITFNWTELSAAPTTGLVVV